MWQAAVIYVEVRVEDGASLAARDDNDLISQAATGAVVSHVSSRCVAG
jgi:hypothetical protein